MALLLLILCSLATVILGLTGYVIFGPLTYRHLMDRRATVGSSSFAPVFWWWLLRGGYRANRDPNLSGLATPARIMLVIIASGLAGCLLWSLIKAGQLGFH
ncbi:MAG: hypothetical protein CVV14_01420 [Gammaproteobacteria bacterium HGW-Gammaproteobacteria-4]|jgi:hypothetical protein|nr:MAG: hypothetical protein CVV14_01420 [Gammaproteobacteria bacterium HGW-Gammaproteobacteria-4]